MSPWKDKFILEKTMYWVGREKSELVKELLSCSPEEITVAMDVLVDEVSGAFIAVLVLIQMNREAWRLKIKEQ